MMASLEGQRSRLTPLHRAPSPPTLGEATDSNIGARPDVQTIGSPSFTGAVVSGPVSAAGCDPAQSPVEPRHARPAQCGRCIRRAVKAHGERLKRTHGPSALLTVGRTTTTEHAT